MKFKFNAQKTRQLLIPFVKTFPWLLIKCQNNSIFLYGKDEIAFKIAIAIEWIDFENIQATTYISTHLFYNVLKGYTDCNIEILGDKIILTEETKIDSITLLKNISLTEINLDEICQSNTKICLLKPDFELIKNATKFISNTMDCVNSLRYVEITSTSSQLLVVSSDGKRCYSCEFSPIESSYSYFLADKNLILLVDKMIGKLPDDTLISIYIEETAIGIEGEDTLLFFSLPTIKYPDVQGLYPDSSQLSYLVDSKNLLNAAKECQGIDVGKKYDKITLVFSEDQLRIVSKIPEIGTSTRTVDIEKEKEGNEEKKEENEENASIALITLPTRYLIEAIEGITGKLTISVNGSKQPIMISGNNSDRLLMPLIN